jgi:hypothetical protein
MNTSNRIRILNIKLILLLVSFEIPLLLFSQTHVFKGSVKDEKTLKPIPDVNVHVEGSKIGSSTNSKGEFIIQLETLPSTIVVSCIGYDNFTIKINEIPKNVIEFSLKPKSYNLKEVNVKSSAYNFIFKDKYYSILDYELMDGNPLLLVFRTLLNKSELVLLNRIGDTLTVSKLPEVHPAQLHKDFLRNVYYFSRANNAYQLYFDRDSDTLQYLPAVEIDSMENIFRFLIFKISNKVYFNESQANGFGTAFGFYQKGVGKKYIRQYLNEKKLSESIDDQKFYAIWNQLIASQIPPGEMTAEKFAKSPKLGQYMNQYDSRAYNFEFYKMIYPVIKTKDNNIAFFNFGDNVIEFYEPEGKLIRIVPISFHKESFSVNDSVKQIQGNEPNWKWSRQIIIDESTSEVYTTFTRSGMLRINRIDLQSGRLKPGTVLPFLFPKKIEIFNGEAFFLNKGLDENWKLVKCKL